MTLYTLPPAVPGDLFVSDTGAGVIFRCSLMRCKKIITSALGRVEGLAVDRITRKVHIATTLSKYKLNINKFNYNS